MTLSTELFLAQKHIGEDYTANLILDAGDGSTIPCYQFYLIRNEGPPKTRQIVRTGEFYEFSMPELLKRFDEYCLTCFDCLVLFGD